MRRGDFLLAQGHARGVGIHGLHKNAQERSCGDLEEEVVVGAFFILTE